MRTRFSSLFIACTLLVSSLCLGYAQQEPPSAPERIQLAQLDVVEPSVSSTWSNQPFSPYSGRFAASYSVTPLASNMDGLVVLSRGAVQTFDSAAVAVRFNTSGVLDVRDGDVYRADVRVPYQANQTFRFRLSVDVPRHRYSVWVTPPGQSEVLLASNYAFRTSQQGVTQLDNVALWAGVGDFQWTGFTTGQEPAMALRLVLVNATTGQDIAELTNGYTIDFAVTGDKLNVRADGASAVESVSFTLDGQFVRTESSSPLTLAGDTASGYNPWTPSAGSHTLVATPYDQDAAGGSPGVPVSVSFTVRTTSTGTSRLSWAPPRSTYDVTLNLNTNSGTYFDGFNGKHVQVIPKTTKDTRNKLHIVGAASVTLIGGHFEPTGQATASLYFQGITGFVFIEGVVVDNINAGERDAMQVSAGSTPPNIYLQNSRFVNVQGSNAGEHGDAFQTGSRNMGKAGHVRIDRFTAEVGYQGIFVDPQEGGGLTSLTVKNTNLRRWKDNAQQTFFFYGKALNYYDRGYPISLENVWSRPWGTETIDVNEVWPDSTASTKPEFGITKFNAVKGTDSAGTFVHWPGLQDVGKQLQGRIYSGDPSTGDFVSRGSVGLNYQSPGYQ